MGTCVSSDANGADDSNRIADPSRITATFPGDPDYGKVIYEAPETTTKTVPKVINKTAPKLISKVSRKSMSRCRTRCYLDIAIDGEAVGRIVIELRTDVNPRTCENFRALCTAKYGYSYKECKFHRIIPNFVLQTGDVELKTEKREGNGGVSIYGRSFADEDLKTLRHHQYGIVSMANCGPHTNNSQFMIVMDPDGTEWLDGKHTVFGQVEEESFDTLKAIENCAEVFEREDKRRARIIKTATVTDCGEL